ncbi:MAG: PQQ-dependent sugar dehydrogenase [Saprospiraceae bacterium]
MKKTTKQLLFLSLFALVSAALYAQPKIQLENFASGFVRPVDIAHHGTSDLYVVEQRGLIWIVDSMGNKSSEAFLNIDQAVRSSGNEQGLLGLAFHPNYENNGYFYVYYTREPDGDTRVARYSRDASDPQLADPNSEVILLTQNQPFTNHNGGCIKFGPDGYLYIGLGDGGSGGDPQGNAQNTTTFLGKILRIDVDTPGANYSVPADNPYVNTPGYLPEIWSLGWRNPWRFSFDRQTGDLWVADVGQNAWESIYVQAAGTGGLNYGWRCYEGNHPYNTSGCPAANNFVSAIYEYPNPNKGCSITGGFVYRGDTYSDLFGKYIYTDYCSGRWWVTEDDGAGGYTTQEIADLSNFQYSSLGEDYKGELYVALLSQGRIQKLTELCSAFQISGTVTDATCYGTLNGSIELDITGGAGNVDLIWSNGAINETSIIYLDPGTYTVVGEDANGCERSASFVVGAEMQIETPLAETMGGADPSICPGTSITLTATEAPTDYGYQWLLNGEAIAGADQQNYTATEAGTYSLHYQGALCQSAPSNDIVVTVQAVPEPVIGISSGQAILCPGATATLSVSAFADYDIQWFNGGVAIAGVSDASLIVDAFGEYSVSLSGVCGVFSSDIQLIDEEVVIPPAVGTLGDSLIGTPGWAAYQWYFGGTLIAGATESGYTATESGYYECQFTSDNGCTYIAGAEVMVSRTSEPSQILSLEITPNPTTHSAVLKLELEQKDKVWISLQDAANQQIFNQSVQGKSITKTIDLHALPAGSYFLHIQTSEGRIVRTIVKN